MTGDRPGHGKLGMLAVILILSVTETPDGSIVIDANVAAIITALALLVTAITGLVVALQTKRGLGQVHTLVNSHASDQAQRIAQLGAALQAAGIQIPNLAPPTVTGIPPSKYPAPPLDPNVPDTTKGEPHVD